ncbi:PriCT-2 domain-containing protein [Paraburkholderia sartisoli]|uniref:Putative DNA primase/helicase n=1 Tax=Paraburkholderia sartisoli TaxID=83784 RepID=A0A1H4CHL2_9BURK|nr:PriCT-2 domain-containing protein [Paraburkholderia sartisoli]SEA59809.1 putative DNA primase/helicase [Paraburkholderia sartisoli]
MNAPCVDETSRVRAALAVIPADDYATWVDMAFAVRQGLGDAGFEIWDEWSRSAHNYNERAARTTWRSARASGGKTLASLFWLAQQHGFDLKASRVPGAIAAASQGRDREALARRTREAAREETRVRARHAAVAQTAVSIWEWARPVAPEHPYLVCKQIEPVTTLRELEALELKALLGYTPVSEEEPLAGRVLIVPAWVRDTMTTLELIDGAGRKSSLAGGAKKGGYWVTGPLPADAGSTPILIAEGVATALSAHRATGWIAVAALSAGNLPQVAANLRERYAHAPLLVLGEPGKGESFARQAGQEGQAHLVLPSFAPDARIDGMPPTDFNDMAVLSGLDAVGELLRDVAGRINTDRPAVAGAVPGADAGRAVDDTAVEWMEDADMARKKEELTDAMTDDVAGTKERRARRRQQKQDAPVREPSPETGTSGVQQHDAGRAGADTDSGPPCDQSVESAQDAQAAGHPGEEGPRAAPRREIGAQLYGPEDVPGEIRALAQHRFGARIRMATPRENGGPYRGEVLNTEHYVIQEVATRSVVFHRKDHMEFVSDRLKWMDQNQRMNGAEVQIGYDGDRPKVYPWDRARDQLERVVASLKKSAREAGFGADLDPTLDQLQSVSWARFREARAAALAQARERAAREPAGNPDR